MTIIYRFDQDLYFKNKCVFIKAIRKTLPTKCKIIEQMLESLMLFDSSDNNNNIMHVIHDLSLVPYS